MLKNNILDKSYPRCALILFFNWLMFTNMPFLGSYKYYLIAIQIISIVPYLFSKNDLSETFKMNIPCCLFLAIVLISSIFTKSFFNKNLWMTLFTLITAFEFISTADKKEIEKLLSNIYISLEIIMTLSLIGILLVKLTDLENSDIFTISYSLGNFIQYDRFFGVLNNCNLLGPLAGIATILSLNKIKESRNNHKQLIIDILFLIINIYLLIGSGSFTAIFALCFSLVVMFLCKVKKHRTPIFISVILIGIMILTVSIINIDFLSIVLDKDLRTATSRVDIWKSCFEILKDHPFIGYGSNENYIAASLSKDLFIHPNGTHNMYVEIATLYGYPAVMIYIALILTTIIRMLKYYFKGYVLDDATILIPFLCIIFGMIQGFGEGQQLFTNSPIMILFLASLIITNYNLHKFSEQASNKNLIQQ